MGGTESSWDAESLPGFGSIIIILYIFFKKKII